MAYYSTHREIHLSSVIKEAFFFCCSRMSLLLSPSVKGKEQGTVACLALKWTPKANHFLQKLRHHWKKHRKIVRTKGHGWPQWIIFLIQRADSRNKLQKFCRRLYEFKLQNVMRANLFLIDNWQEIVLATNRQTNHSWY